MSETRNISLFKVFMDPTIDKHLTPVLKSGMITQSTQVEEFERELRDWCSHPYICTLNSATSGLILALRMLDLQPGDEVLTTPLTCLATNFPILTNGLRIKWVDTNPETCNIDLDDLENKITKTTRAIIVVHWGGTPVDMDRLNAIRDRYNIPIVEDAAHAFGARFNETHIGTHGNIAVFSTQAIKHLTTGDGGLIFLPTDELYQRARRLRWYGIDRERRSGGGDFRMEPDVPEWGYKFHMNDIAACIGRRNLRFMTDNIFSHRHNAMFFNKHLRNIPGIRLISAPPKSCSSYWIYTICVEKKSEFIKFMKNRGIMTSQVHNRNDGHSCMQDFKTSLPQLDLFEQSVVCIPVGWWLRESDLEYIVNCIVDFSTDVLGYMKIAPLTRKYYRDYAMLIGEMYNMDVDVDNNLQDRVEDMNGDVYVAIRDNKVMGSVKVLYEKKLLDNVVHVEDVVVAKKYRGKGYGKVMVRNILNIIKDKYKCYKIVLECRDELEKFYTDTGMKKCGITFAYKII